MLTSENIKQQQQQQQQQQIPPENKTSISRRKIFFEIVKAGVWPPRTHEQFWFKKIYKLKQSS